MRQTRLRMHLLDLVVTREQPILACTTLIACLSAGVLLHLLYATYTKSHQQHQSHSTLSEKGRLLMGFAFKQV